MKIERHFSSTLFL